MKPSFPTRVVRRAALAPSALCAIALATHADVPELALPGPHPVGWMDVTITGSAGDFVNGRVYYPALEAGNSTDPAVGAGPFPLASFIHGALVLPPDYDDLCGHIASHGWVLVSLGTSGTVQMESRHTKDLMHWLDDESQIDDSFFAGMVSAEHGWAAGGHSAGGGVLQRLVKKEPLITAAFALAPSFDPGDANGLPKYQGSLLVLVGDADTTTPPDEDAHPYFVAAQATRRRIYIEAEGMGHDGPTDTPLGIFGSDMPWSVSHRWNKRLPTALLYAEILGVEDAYTVLLGEHIDTQPFASIREADCASPALWTCSSLTAESTLAVGLAGAAGDEAFVMVSAHASTLETPFGTFGLDPVATTFLSVSDLDDRGWMELSAPLPSALSGHTFFLQGLRIGAGDAAFSATEAIALP